MRDTTRHLRVDIGVEETTVQRIIRTGLAVVGLLLLLGLLAVLPGISRLVSGLTISMEALLFAVATLVVVVAFVRIAPMIERLVEQNLDGQNGAVANAAASAKLLVGFTAIVIAYRGFQSAASPLFNAFGIGGLYHLGFLLLGIGVFAAFARRMYRCWDPLTRLLTTYVMDATSETTQTLSSE